MRKYILSGMVVLATSLSLYGQDSAVGRWDLTVGRPGQTWPAWVGVTEKDGKYEAQFQPAAGSVGGVEDLKVDGNKLAFKAHGMTIEAAVTGDSMAGTVKKNGEGLPLIGRRFDATPDTAGSWSLKLEKGEQPTLTLTQGAQVGGYLAIGGGQGAPVTGKLEGNRLTLKATLPAAKDRALAGDVSLTAAVKGDMLAGELTGANGKQTFTGQRSREWGKPIDLFNGKDLDGWKPIGDAANSHWKVVDGVMTNTAHGANIVSDRKFEDFKVHVEFRVPEHGNSGVYLRGRYEIQVADSFDKPAETGGCAAIYGRIAPRTNPAKKAGEWQTLDATLIGNHVTVAFNGETVIDNQEIAGITGGALDSNEATPGPIYLQGDHSAVEYRKIVVTPAQGTVTTLLRIGGQPTTQPR